MTSAANVYCYDESEIEAFVKANADRLLKPEANVTAPLPSPEMVMLKSGREIPAPPKLKKEKAKEANLPLADDTPVRKPAVTVAMDDQGNVRRKVNRTEADTIKANHEMMAALERERQREADLDDFMRKETLSLRARKEAEAQRIAAVQAEKAKAAKAKVSISVMTTEGRQHSVRRITTTTDRLAKDRKLPDHLKACLDAFAVLVGDAVGASTRDGDDGTNRLTISYDGYSGSPVFASKSLSDRQLVGATALREMAARVPEELRETFAQVVAEEIGYRGVKSKTLRELGEALGYLHKQSTAAGGATVYCITAMIAHYMRELQRQNCGSHPLQILPEKNILEAA